MECIPGQIWETEADPELKQLLPGFAPSVI